MSNALDRVLSSIMVVAPTLGYFDQIRLIVKTKTSFGFSSATCAILCFANILRLFFWFGKRFDNILLLQSIVMLVTMLMLLYVVVSYKQSNTFYQCLIRSNSVDSYTSLESYESTNYPTLKNCVCISSFLDSFWAWDNYIDYINCLLLFTCFVGILYIFLHQYSAFIEVVGFIGLGCEATLPLPQLVTNFKQRSTKGFSLLILSSWFVGDGFKVFYFIYRNSPTQFILCAFVQLSLDVLLVLQFIVFSSWAKKLLNIQSTISLDGDIYNQC